MLVKREMLARLSGSAVDTERTREGKERDGGKRIMKKEYFCYARRTNMDKRLVDSYRSTRYKFRRDRRYLLIH